MFEILITIYILINSNLYLNKKIEKLKDEIFISSPNDYLKSFLILVLFVIGFVFCFRVLRVFFSKTSYIYFKDYEWIYTYISNVKILIFIIIIIIIIILFLKKLVTIYIKLYFVKVLLFNYEVINAIFLYVKNIYRYGIKKNYIYWVVIPRIINYILIILQLVIYKNYIYLGWLPWYALYYFIINCLIFYGDFKSNFDAGVYIFYKGINLKEDGLYKIRKYQLFLIFKDNSQKFL
ncbi:MAG: hypothetical protein EOP33_06435 [Rickettsiaceae bacterium]|nr:MAG: hypothetical protein EOP33_06435 [Rickettsiaceae bacterium]